MNTGIPYFSNFALKNKSTARVHFTPLKPSSVISTLGLGIPASLKTTYTPVKGHLTDVFPSTQPKPQTLLAAAETTAVIDRQFAEVNKSKFLDLASTDTVKNFSKFAQSASNKFNPLRQPGTSTPKTKKRRLDIFD